MECRQGAGFVRRTDRERGVSDRNRAPPVGAATTLHYGLGHLAQIDGNRAVAHERLRRSLEALKKLEKAPDGTIVTELVRRTRPE